MIWGKNTKNYVLRPKKQCTYLVIQEPKVQVAANSQNAFADLKGSLTAYLGLSTHKFINSFYVYGCSYITRNSSFVMIVSNSKFWLQIYSVASFFQQALPETIWSILFEGLSLAE